MRRPRRRPGGERKRAAAAVATLALGLALGCGAPEAITGCAPAQGRTPVCAFTNPEDLASAGGGWVLVSQYPEAEGSAGSLVAWQPPDGEPRPLFPDAEASLDPRADAADPGCPGPPDEALFAPHGIDLAPGHEASTLWVVNHGGREAVERFRLEGVAEAAPRLVWEGCVPLPEEAQANDLAALPDGGFAVTWFMPRASGPGLALVFARVALGLDTGRVLRWRPGEGFEAVPGTEASAPNGIEASPDGRVLFVAAWGDRRLLRVPLDGAPAGEVALPHRPDNLTWAPDGRLLVTGQETSFARVARCLELEAGTCALPWSVLAVEPESLATQVVLREDPAVTTGAASVTLETGEGLLVGTFDGDRIVWAPR